MQAACGLSKTLKGWATSFLTSTDLRAAPWATQVPSSAKDEGNLPEAQQDLAGHHCPEHPVYEKKRSQWKRCPQIQLCPLQPTLT